MDNSETTQTTQPETKTKKPSKLPLILCILFAATTIGLGIFIAVDKTKKIERETVKEIEYITKYVYPYDEQSEDSTTENPYEGLSIEDRKLKFVNETKEDLLGTYYQQSSDPNEKINKEDQQSITLKADGTADIKTANCSDGFYIKNNLKYRLAYGEGGTFIISIDINNDGTFMDEYYYITMNGYAKHVLKGSTIGCADTFGTFYAREETE